MNVLQKRAKLAFEHLNLRINPFGELPLADRILYVSIDTTEYQELMSGTRTAIQFLGHKGHGKTTILLAIHHNFPNSYFLNIGERERAGVIPQSDPLFIDEAQRLTWLQRRRLFKRDCNLVISTHVDFSQHLRRAGFSVHSTEVAKLTNDEQLYQSFNKRVELARRSNAAIPKVTRETVRQLRNQFGPDIRAMEWELYDRFQVLREIKHG